MDDPILEPLLEYPKLGYRMMPLTRVQEITIMAIYLLKVGIYLTYISI